MKSIFILLCALFIFNGLHAQVADKGSVRPNQHRACLRHLLTEADNCGSTLRATSTAVRTERVIAQSIRDNSIDSLSDSVNIKYGINQGSVYDYNMMEYAYNYPYSASPMFNFNGVFTTPQVLYDTIKHWTINPYTLIYGLYESGSATYDTHKNLTMYNEVFADSVTNKNMSYINSFTATNNIASGYWLNHPIGAGDSAFKQFFTYNSLNKLTKDSIYEYHSGWHLAARTYYTYDTLHNLIKIDGYSNTTDTTFRDTLKEQVQYINTYDTSHRLHSVLTSYYNGTSLSPYVKDTFGYSGAHTYHNSWKEYQYDPINGYWTPILYMTKQLNASGLPDTVNIQGWDSLSSAWVPQTMDVIKYDTAKNPDTLKDYEYNFGSFPSVPNYTTVYYYNSFINKLAVNIVKTLLDKTRIFPNPASNTLTIFNDELLEGAPISVILMNVSGQVISKTTVSWSSATQISVRELNAGIYWITVMDQAGNIVHTQAIRKQ